MTKHDKKEKKHEEKVDEQVIEEQSIIEEINEAIEESKEKTCNSDYDKLKETFSRQQADFDNFKKRVERDREDMMFYLKSDILKKVLPRIDDLQRIIAQTPESERT
jgi:molecular chaperone GrpE